MKTGLSTNLGVLRSLAMYYGIPRRQARMRGFYSQFIRPGDLCFDIGSHVGNRIKAWTAIGARVVAVEPQPQLFRWLERWYGDDPRVLILGCGLGAAQGVAELQVSSRTPTVTSFSDSWINEVRKHKMWQPVEWDQRVKVRMRTLDTLIQQLGPAQFCKIDVEGYELEVLKGLSYPIPALSFEFIPAARSISIACIDRLQELGTYVFNWSMVETMRLQSESWLSAKEMQDILQAMPLQGRSGDVYARLTTHDWGH